MKKITIITSDKSNAGKSFLAKNMKLMYENPVFLCGRNRSSIIDFRFKNLIKKETDLVVLDDLREEFVKNIVHLFLSNSLLIHPMNSNSFEVLTPHLIITTSNFNPKEFSFHNLKKINLIKCNLKRIDDSTVFFSHKKINTNI